MNRMYVLKNTNLPKYLGLGLVALMTLSSCRKGAEQSTQQMAKKLPVVKVQPATKLRMVSYIDITGTLEANILTEIKSPAGGTLESLMARENQRVEKNKIIAVINPGDRVALISQGRQKIGQIEKKIEGSAKESNEDSLLMQELEKAEQELEYAENMYQTIPVICPMSGLVTQRWIDEGSQVAFNDKILTVSDMSSLVIKAEVNEKYFEAIKQGKKLPIILNAYPGDSLTGFISLIYPQVDPVTRSVKFDIKIQNFRKNLLPGMMASIRIPVSVIEEAVSVPEQAVLSSPDNKNFLFVIDKDSIAHRRIVETGINWNNKLQITRGVKETEKVVTDGQEMLKDSLKVKIIK